MYLDNDEYRLALIDILLDEDFNSILVNYIDSVGDNTNFKELVMEYIEAVSILRTYKNELKELGVYDQSLLNILNEVTQRDPALLVKFGRLLVNPSESLLVLHFLEKVTSEEDLDLWIRLISYYSDLGGEALAQIHEIHTRFSYDVGDIIIIDKFPSFGIYLFGDIIQTALNKCIQRQDCLTEQDTFIYNRQAIKEIPSHLSLKIRIHSDVVEILSESSNDKLLFVISRRFLPVAVLKYLTEQHLNHLRYLNKSK